MRAQLLYLASVFAVCSETEKLKISQPNTIFLNSQSWNRNRFKSSFFGCWSSQSSLSLFSSLRPFSKRLRVTVRGLYACLSSFSLPLTALLSFDRLYCREFVDISMCVKGVCVCAKENLLNTYKCSDYFMGKIHRKIYMYMYKILTQN